MTGSKKEYKTSLSIFLTGLLNVKQTQVALASQNDADKLAQCHIGIASCMTGDGGGEGMPTEKGMPREKGERRANLRAP